MTEQPWSAGLVTIRKAAELTGYSLVYLQGVTTVSSHAYDKNLNVYRRGESNQKFVHRDELQEWAATREGPRREH